MTLAAISGLAALAVVAPPLAIGGMRGIQPALDLPFAQHGSLVGLHPLPIALTRSSGGVYFDGAGVLQTSGADSARFDHTFDGTNWIARGLLIEEARTNLALQSETVAAPWTSIGNLGVVSNNSVAPDGTTTMDRLNDVTFGGFDGMSQNVTIPSTNLPYTYPVYVQKFVQSTFPEFQIDMTGGTRVRGAVQLDTETGATVIRLDTGGGGAAVSVEELENHWRISLTLTNVGSNTNLQIVIFPSVTATFGVIETSAIGGINVWGHQLEQGAFATSYIATTTAAITRAVDVATVTDLTWFNVNEGTFYVEASFSYSDANGHDLLDVDDGGITDRFRLRRDASENVNFSTKHSTGANGASNGAAVIAAGTKFKVAGAYSVDGIRAAVDGVLNPADAAAAIPLADAMTTLRIGATVVGGQWDGHIARVTYWPIRLPDLQLQALTS